MGQAAKVLREDAAPDYVSQIRELVEKERVGAARKLVDDVLREYPHDPELLRWKEVLSPARVLGKGPAAGYDGGVDFRWISEHGRDYEGQWVAVLKGKLLAHAPTLNELSARLKELAPQGLPLVHHIRGTE